MKKTAIVIEDDPRYRRIFRKSLEKHGYDVTDVCGATDLDRLSRGETSYSLAIVDYRLWGGIDGSEVAVVLSQKAIAECIVIVSAFTEYFSREIYKSMRKHGIPVIAKPCTITDILKDPLIIGKLTESSDICPEHGKKTETHVVSRVPGTSDEDVGLSSISPSPVIIALAKSILVIVRTISACVLLSSLVALIRLVSSLDDFGVDKIALILIVLIFVGLGIVGCAHPKMFAEQMNNAWNFLSGRGKTSPGEEGQNE